MNKKNKQFLNQVNAYTWHDLCSNELKEVLKNCVKTDRPLVYSIIKEIILRITGLSLFDTQLLAASVLENGKCVELPTGEGKTLCAVVAACSMALNHRKVHVMTFNDYLAKRDYTEHQKIFSFCGLSCGCIVESNTILERKHTYKKDIVYTTAKEIGFDYLRNFMAMEPEEFIAIPFDVAIIDEVDSILIDEARIPLVIARNNSYSTPLKQCIDGIVKSFTDMELTYNSKTDTFYLSESGITKAEKSFNIPNLYSSAHMDTLSLINASIEANYSLSINKDYIVKDGQVLVVDQITGRIAYNRRFPDLIHQAILVKENLKEGESTVVCNSIPLQFFLLKYPFLSGMSGTVKSSAKELKSSYQLETEVIPPHVPCIRIDHVTEVFCQEEEKIQAILAQVQSCYSQEQPVLIGTQSVKESEHYSVLLTENHLPHQVLNAKNDEEEAVVIQNAGKNNAITISTNMAGRGVDIRTSHPKGLFVIGCGMNDSRRIDLQLIGRSGRQGHPGESKFYIRRDEARVNGCEKSVKKLQQILEGRNAETRYILSKYAYIIELQRQEITQSRDEILFSVTLPLAEKQLRLYFINEHWSTYLNTMENIRSGIHLSILGGLNPIDEYNKASVSAFTEMKAEIENDVNDYLRKCNRVNTRINLETLGLPKASSTFSYMIDESKTQFSRKSVIPHNGFL